MMHGHNEPFGGCRTTRVRTVRRKALATFLSAVVSVALMCALSVPPALALYPHLESQITDSYNPEASGVTGDPYRILIDEAAYTAPSSFWSGLGSNFVSSGSSAIGSFDVVFEDRGSLATAATTDTLVSSMEFDMGAKKHLGVATLGPVCAGQTVWDGTWVYAFRLCPWSERSVSSAGDLRVGFAWKGCFGTYFDDWAYTFNAQDDSASLSPEKNLEPGDTIELHYYGGYNVAQTSRGTLYGIDFDDTSTCIDTTGIGIGGANSGTPTSTIITNEGDPRDASYCPTAMVGEDGYVTFQGSNSIWYGGYYTVVKVADGNGFTVYPVEDQTFTG
ncbi:MAG: hypothetical protein HGA54_09895, partial [Actinobacteria bacterium]|nr:hypothetical protein [Actinomycetota bacterium]